jgi:hypothetical protein
MSHEIIYREETIRGLVKLLERHTVVHVRGTPFSGKTTLSILLRAYLNAQAKPVVLILVWEKTIPASQFLVQVARAKGFLVDESMVYHTTITFIVDEAQTTYEGCDLWNGDLKYLSGRGMGTRMILFASYGSPTIGYLDAPEIPTPLILGPSQRVSLMPRDEPEAPTVGLFFSEAEFYETCERVQLGSARPLPLEPSCRKFIFLLTNGHPAAVHAILHYLRLLFSSQIKHRSVLTISQEAAEKVILDDFDKFRRFIEGQAVRRSLPQPHICDNLISSPGVQDVVLGVLAKNQVTYSNESLRRCIQVGWLQTAQQRRLQPGLRLPIEPACKICRIIVRRQG